MDFSKLLQHCRDKHGVKVDTSKLGEMIRFAIFQYFNQEHDKPLLDGETWEIFEQMQKVRTIENGFSTGIEAADGQMICVGDEVGYMEGEEDSAVFTVVFHDGAFRKKYHHWDQEKDFWPEMQRPREAGPAMKIVKKANVAEITPDYGTGFRPPWDLIGPDYKVCTIDKYGRIFFFTENPKINEAHERWLSDSGHCRFPFEVKAPVENWRECLWIRPGHGEKEGAE